MQNDLEMVIDAKASLGEGPSWDSKNQLLYWVDILQKKVYIHHPVTGENRSITLEHLVGAVVPRKAGGAIVALEKGFYSLNLETEQIEPIHDPERHLPGNRFNDGKCDPYGRFWAGTMDLNEESQKGTLYCLDTEMNVHQKLNKVTISNGIAWSPDHQYMYFIDTPTKKVVRYDYELHTGHIQNPAEVITFKDGEGFPDGMTIDEEGMLWIAHWGGAKISRWDPKNGKQLMAISIPALNVTSCTFGGSDLSDLYITTARKGMDDKELAMYPNTGGVFKLKTGIKGCPTYSFRG